MLKFLVQLILLVQLVVSLPTTLLPPSQDSFYSAPDGYESAEVGTILASRVAPAQIKSVVFDVHVKGVWQLLVRSTDSFGNPNVIVTTVFEPYNADPSKLVTYQVAQDSANLDCAPSYGFTNGELIRNIVGEAETFLIQQALDEGYYVVSPDYEGLKSVFTGGLQAGHAVLDSLRATLKSGNITGVSSSAKTVVWGYSGGSLASGWAAALQPEYAPELASNLIGVALGGWVTNITATVTSVNAGIFSGLGASGIAGLSNEYSELYDFLKTAMPADKYALFARAYDNCLVEDVLEFPFDDFFYGSDRYFTNGISVLNTSPVAEIIQNNTLGLIASNMPQIPVFVYHGQLDGIVPFAQAERVYDIWCAAGIESFEFAVDETAGHITEIVQGSGAGFAWIQNRFNGKKVVSGCQRTNRLSNLFYPGTSTSIAIFLDALVKNVLGLNIGPNGENLVIDNGSLISKTNSTQS
ncbi:hypothetical protein PSN45_004230 [Yamadazyma tenuis]|uniref:LIP-domain-containing protein n=1 Tax=Candida tenuis (strain ATCC 10573 / BCRC 21748 / CBS 615 / JCM 9827 / NBRC 10315 / NRRL Y-1498 / VKM Y-70) TaxID=590646 RepID=G3B6K2_CANTC|nr:LIP-domain-containing protein [Yamadazyma tenuis ATCC 10573]XP_006687489.1 uncharacterized protein CANTEDRAFT_114795 [Yamadazyma tenuis ATCC 10573]EGV63695.1 LIP-domain-containing protein [Yamadazyma tenuis ATCC 10573]EGV63696.1 hypothetical protein CANTEDRAFT_114795 [Yamadazyma tenuis ATCC 10573]WEJ96687.1 hypothetical protein PSN45_004230 [Yamadazyma tenuis]